MPILAPGNTAWNLLVMFLIGNLTQDCFYSAQHECFKSQIDLCFSTDNIDTIQDIELSHRRFPCPCPFTGIGIFEDKKNTNNGKQKKQVIKLLKTFN